MKTSFARSAILAAVLVVIAVASWELYLRKKGFETTYFDDPALWSHKRDMVYEPADKATIFIGSSRIKFDLDQPTWESITGNHAIMLACVGSTPIPILNDLANDKNFKGRLVVDVTEGLFFSEAGGNLRRPEENLKYFKERTPAQTASFHINRVLESQFVFLDKEFLSLNSMLDQLDIPNRKGVNHFKGFPPDFGRVKFDRQEYMTDRMAGDTVIQNQVKNIWASFGRAMRNPPPTGAKLDSVLNGIKAAVDKIKARGGDVIFVRTPSTGFFLAAENQGYPRDKYWERILTTTQCKGIHFKDYPAIANLQCPEFSHLSKTDAINFTKEFIKILEEKGWSFPGKKP